MMPEPLLQSATADVLQTLIARPPHAVALTGSAGMGKKTVARWLAEQLTQASLANYPYATELSPIDGKALSIDQIRELEHLMALTLPTGQMRIVLILDAHTMTGEAANALLKTLEEPPANTVLILTATDEAALLPTIRSRLQIVTLVAPSSDELRARLPAPIADTVMAISGGLPGLAFALAADDQNHPLVQAATSARELLAGTAYTRLAQVDVLAKNKEQAANILYILMQMAHTALLRGGQGVQRWRQVLQAAHEAEIALKNGGQTKLVLTQLMLSL